MKTLFLTSAILLSSAFTQVFASPVIQASVQNAATQSTIAEQNKQAVINFYNGVFTQHQVKKFADRYIGNRYIQHNPHVPDGKAPFVDYFSQYFKENPEAKNTIKRAMADGDIVMLHVHSQQNASDSGTAIVDIFRVEHGKIVEHWDVQQDIPKQSANKNTMF